MNSCKVLNFLGFRLDDDEDDEDDVKEAIDGDEGGDARTFVARSFTILDLHQQV